jgi:hypothetical protein
MFSARVRRLENHAIATVDNAHPCAGVSATDVKESIQTQESQMSLRFHRNIRRVEIYTYTYFHH